ncbi:MAG TPA: M56 family metallopeptidase [Sedimentisphaerales bacterium]|nr:M56 family metallopeptidase [Sedimentisphaerales bacterium]
MLPEAVLSHPTVERVGWTLVHFLWQAAALAVIFGIELALLRKSKANVRYLAGCLTLALMMLAPCLTVFMVPVSESGFAAESHATASMPPEVSTTEFAGSVELSVSEGPHPGPAPSRDVAPSPVTVGLGRPWKERAAALMEPALPYLVLGWLVGVFGLSVWHLGGWAQLQRLRRRMVKPVDQRLRSKLRELGESLGVRWVVAIMESALVQVPTVVGWLKPVILLPASAMTGLTAEQLEAVLAHELAHIRRLDYLVNMVQTAVEILGFYHPAVWWVSHKIRIERENCCDDVAVSVTGNKVRYAKALALLEEMRGSRRGLAVAADGVGLLDRIRRLVGSGSAEQPRSTWLPAAITILLILAIAVPTTIALNAAQDNKLDVVVERDLEDAEKELEERLGPVIRRLKAKWGVPEDGYLTQVRSANGRYVLFHDSRMDVEINDNGSFMWVEWAALACDDGTLLWEKQMRLAPVPAIVIADGGTAALAELQQAPGGGTEAVLRFIDSRGQMLGAYDMGTHGYKGTSNWFIYNGSSMPGLFSSDEQRFYLAVMDNWQQHLVCLSRQGEVLWATPFFEEKDAGWVWHSAEKVLYTDGEYLLAVEHDHDARPTKRYVVFTTAGEKLLGGRAPTGSSVRLEAGDILIGGATGAEISRQSLDGLETKRADGTLRAVKVEVSEVVKVIRLQYADPEDLSERLNAIFSEPGTVTGMRLDETGKVIAMVRFTPDPREKTILVLCPPELVGSVEKMIRELDRPGSGIRVRNFSATLSNGATVELVGLYHGETIKDLVFWKPDGSLFSDSESQKYRERVALPKWQNKDFRFEYGLMTRFSPLDELNTEMFVKQGRRMSTKSPGSDGIAIALVASDPHEREEGFSKVANIKAAAAYGEWDTRKWSAGINDPSVLFLDEHSNIMLSPPRRTGERVGGSGYGGYGRSSPRRKTDERVLDVTVNAGNIDFDCFYELKDGSIHQAEWRETLGQPNWIGPDQRTPMICKRYALSHKPEEITEYIVKYRRFEIVEFKNVSLKPGFKTDVEVVVGHAAPEMPSEPGRQGRLSREEIRAKLASLENRKMDIQRDLNVAEDAMEEVRARWGFGDLEERSYPHPVTARLMRLEKERDDCLVEMAQLEARIGTIEKQADSPQKEKDLKKAREDLAALTGKLEQLQKMCAEAAAKKNDLDTARLQYRQRASVRDERKRMLDSIKAEIEKLKTLYDDPATPEGEKRQDEGTAIERDEEEKAYRRTMEKRGAR